MKPSPRRTALLAIFFGLSLVILASCSSNGAPAGATLKIVSDLPLTGSAKQENTTIVNAITMRIEESGGTACGGKYHVLYESHDDASASAGQWDPAVVKQNAKLYADDPQVIGVVGTWNSGAAQIMIPMLNQTSTGPLVMVSPANTYVGLTKPFAQGEPGIYYPSGVRNYARVVPNDFLQGQAAAGWAKQLGIHSAYILDDGQLYGKGLAEVVHQNLQRLGVTVYGQQTIDGKAISYAQLMAKIMGFKPDLIYYGGITQNNAGQLRKDMVAAEFTGLFMGPDGIYEQVFIETAGAQAAAGTLVTFAGIPPDELTGKAGQWRDSYKNKFGGDPEVYAIYGYDSASVILAAIERVCAAGGNPTDRATVTKEVLNTKDFNGASGTFSFDADGDTTAVAVSGAKVVNGKFVFQEALSGE